MKRKITKLLLCMTALVMLGTTTIFAKEDATSKIPIEVKSKKAEDIKVEYDSASNNVTLTDNKNTGGTIMYTYYDGAYGEYWFSENTYLGDELNFSFCTNYSKWFKYDSSIFNRIIPTKKDCEDIFICAVAVDSDNNPLTGVTIQKLGYTAPKEVKDNIKLDVSQEKDESGLCKVSMNIETKTQDSSLSDWVVTDEDGKVYSEGSWDLFTPVYKDTVEFTVANKVNLTLLVKDSQLNEATKEFSITEVKSSDDIKPVDSEAPTLTYTLPDKGIDKGTEAYVIVKANEPCNIVIDGVSYDNTTEAKHLVAYNCDLNVTAYDSSENITDLKIKVDCFKDASITGLDDTDKELSSTFKDLLPQTGSISWYLLLITSLSIVVVGVAVLIYLRKKGGKVNE